MKKVLITFCFLCTIALQNNAQVRLSWANSYGSTAAEEAYACVSDSAGNIYTVGIFNGLADFDGGIGVYNLTASGNDAYVLKTDSNGTFTWAFKIGNTGTDQGITLALDSAGHLVIGGVFSGTVDFDPGAGTTTRTSNGGTDFFVLKVDTAGQFIWVKTIGGNNEDWINDLSLDPFGNIYVTGQFRSTTNVDFDPGAGTNYSSTNGTWSAFILKIDTNGNYIWHKKLAGTSNVLGWRILSDSLKNVYINGTFAGINDFNPDPADTSSLTSLGGIDLFVLKLDSSGIFKWVKQIKNTANIDSRGFTLGENTNLYLAGYFYGTIDCDPDTLVYNLTSSGDMDAFVLKIDSAGDFIWAKKYGNSSSDGFYDAYFTSSGQVLLAGFYNNTVNFDPGFSNSTLTAKGFGDALALKLDTDGNYLWAKSFGGTSSEYGYCVLEKDFNNPVIMGSFSGTADFNPGPGVYEKTSNGSTDFFQIKLIPCETSFRYDSVVVCDSYTWINGMTYTYDVPSVSHIMPGAAASGCDSIVYLNLTVNQSYFFPFHAYTCENSEYMWRGQTLSSGGLYYDTLTTVNGCDSLFELLLTVVPDFENIQNEQICNGDSLLWRGNYYSSANTYYDSLNTVFGCDSVYVLDLIVHPTYEFVLNAEICDNESYLWRGNIYSNAGTYYENLNSVNGCDSIYILNLIVHPTYVTLSEVEICDDETYSWRGFTLDTTGIYYDSLTTQNGCDSVFILNLIVHPTYVILSEVEVCDNESYFWHGNTYTSAGTYYDSLSTISGCDSIHMLHLIVNPTFEFSENAEICSNENYFWRGNNYNTSGIFYDSLHTLTGCDSLYVLDLIVHPAYVISDDIDICSGDVFSWHGNNYSTSGIYYDSLQTQYGCDSVHVLNLIVHPLPVVEINNTDSVFCIYNPAASLIENPAGGTFSGQGMSGNIFDPAAAGIGTWPVEYTYSDTNGCQNYATVNIVVDDCAGIESLNNGDISIYPNPTSGQLSITFPAEYDYTISFIDALGQIIQKEQISAQKTIQLDLNSVAPGVYMLKIENDGGFVMKRVVVE